MVDAINVNGTIYKIDNGSLSVSLDKRNIVLFDYPWYYMHFSGVEQKGIEFLNTMMYNADGSTKRYEWPPGSDNYDTQWWNIFNPYNQIPDPRK